MMNIYGGGFSPFGMGSSWLGAIIFVLVLIFWIFMIVDCANRKFKNSNEKIVWIVVMVISPFIGAVVYYFVVNVLNKKGIA